ncbi:DUF3391 domain-containing protein [Pseudomonas sp.]|uniref:DUF3391 domain-containing protein n=1 Tax=Pseudomonas sp. TaxID=306 RepID=UPI004053AA53
MADEAKPDRVKVDAAQLTIGMYVVELDRPWTDTTFLFQGFRIRQQQDIRLLQEVCRYVWVDAQQSVTVHDQVTTNIAQPEALQPVIAKVDFNLEMLQAAPTWHAAREESLRILQAVKLGRGARCRRSQSNHQGLRREHPAQPGRDALAGAHQEQRRIHRRAFAARIHPLNCFG